MASLFKKKTVDDIIKEQTKELRGTQRQITRDRAALEKQEKQMEMEIKKMAKSGNREACKILAKQLVQLRKQKNRTYAVSSKVTSMSTQTKVMNSQMKMAGAMSATAKTMQAVNKKMDPQKTLQTMQDFQKENMKMGMTEDMINDTLDEIFDESGDEEESQDIVNQVLDEIGIEISGKDNDPKHTPRLCKGYLTKKESDGVLHQMTWPPQSPDFNPVEMVWDKLDLI
uniref:Uncharacterized protein n=1 Tax=Oncorhynchus tshawytscha TaxID=74940 RepID=A0AAZ3RZ77_ONCTS